MSSSSMGDAADRLREESRSESAAYDKITKRNAIVSPLLRLPAEIRNNIYHYVFCDLVFEMGLMETDDGNTIVSAFEHDKRDLSLTRVSRQIHQETTLLPFKLATFEFINVFVFDGSVIRAFLDSLSRAQIEAVGNLRLRFFDMSMKLEVTEDTGVNWARALGCPGF